MHTSQTVLRVAHINDLEEMQSLFVDTILAVCKVDYSMEQIFAWTSAVDNAQRWVEKLENQYFLIAQQDSKVVGFGSLEKNDHLDFMYVHKDYQRQGIASSLYDALETEAVRKNAKTLSVDVSVTAKPFFEKMGFKMLSNQTVVINGVKINNFSMLKNIV